MKSENRTHDVTLLEYYMLYQQTEVCRWFSAKARFPALRTQRVKNKDFTQCLRTQRKQRKVQNTPRERNFTQAT